MFDRGERIACARLGYVGTVAALARRVSGEDWARVALRLEADWRNMTHLPGTGEALERAARLAHRYKLRGADAVHLAVALELHGVLDEIREPMVLVASDGEL